MSSDFALYSLQRIRKVEHCTVNLRKNKGQVFNFVKLYVKGVKCKSEKSAVVLQSLNWAQNYMYDGLAWASPLTSWSDVLLCEMG